MADSQMPKSTGSEKPPFSPRQLCAQHPVLSKISFMRVRRKKGAPKHLQTSMPAAPPWNSGAFLHNAHFNAQVWPGSHQTSALSQREWQPMCSDFKSGRCWVSSKQEHTLSRICFKSSARNIATKKKLLCCSPAKNDVVFKACQERHRRCGFE